MRNKYLIFAAVVVILAAAIFIFGRIGGNPSGNVALDQPSVIPPMDPAISAVNTPAAPDQTADAVVNYTDNGFEPSSLSVKKGSTVIFKNVGSSAFWPASNPHPIHTEYPTTGGCTGSTFDACGPIQPGDSWPFKFDIAGTWGFHNHLNPSQTGKIIVQ